MNHSGIRHDSAPSGQGRHRQRGIIATYIAVVVLMVTLMASIALLRSVDTSNTVAGSLTFRQGALQEADRAYKDAVTRLLAYSTTTLQSDQAKGYYASIQSATTSQGIPTILAQATPSSTAVNVMSVLSSGNQVYYVIERLCPAAGPAAKSTCIVPAAAITGGSSSNASSDPGTPFNTTGMNAAFRLSVMVQGPKNTQAFVQTILR